MVKLIKYAKLWKKAKCSIGAIPPVYKTRVDPKLYKYNSKTLGKLKAQYKKAQHTSKLQFQTTTSHAQFDNLTPDKCAVARIRFFTGGEYPDINGDYYNFSEDVVRATISKYIGQLLYVSHEKESPPLAMGKVYDSWLEEQDGKLWMYGDVMIPEGYDYTKNFIDRIESGLVKFLSVTHNFQNKGKEVIAIQPKGIAVVDEPEVKGAEILSIKRNQPTNIILNQLKNRLKSLWQQLRGEDNGRRN